MSDVNGRPETEAEETEMTKHLAPEEREELEALNEMLSDPGFIPHPWTQMKWPTSNKSPRTPWRYRPPSPRL